MLTFYLVALFISGLILGSFLNALEYRLHSGLDWVKSRSICPKCKHNLGLLDLIPVFSWIMLRGRCNYCKEKISWQYPLVELLMAILFSLYGYIYLSDYFKNVNFPTHSSIAIFLFGLVVIWGLVFFTVYDIKYGLIPDKVLFPFIIITFFRNLIFIFLINIELLDYTGFSIMNNLISAFVAGGFFFLIIYLTKGKGMGGGDMKLAFWFGLLFGGLPTLLVLYFAFILGGIYGVIIILVGKKKFGQTVPFGPFLCFGAILVLFYQDLLVSTFMKMFLGEYVF